MHKEITTFWQCEFQRDEGATALGFHTLTSQCDDCLLILLNILVSVELIKKVHKIAGRRQIHGFSRDNDSNIIKLELIARFDSVIRDSMKQQQQKEQFRQQETQFASKRILWNDGSESVGLCIASEMIALILLAVPTRLNAIRKSLFVTTKSQY